MPIQSYSTGMMCLEAAALWGWRLARGMSKEAASEGQRLALGELQMAKEFRGTTYT